MRSGTRIPPNTSLSPTLILSYLHSHSTAHAESAAVSYRQTCVPYMQPLAATFSFLAQRNADTDSSSTEYVTQYTKRHIYQATLKVYERNNRVLFLISTVLW